MTGPTQAHHRRLAVLWRAAGVSDRGERLALTGAFLGRPVASSNELTADEARRLIAYMARLKHQGLLDVRARGWLIAQGVTA